MNGQNEVAYRMEKIREIFQHIMQVCAGQDDLKLLVEELEHTANEFRSVAYESASMLLALKDFPINNALNSWRLFMKGPGAKHAAQVHAGLGWALAQQRIALLPVIETIDPLMQFRVLDGYGYYDGIFRQRKTIGEHLIPPDFNNEFLMGYDQGVGRSLWYICKGDILKIPGLLAGFSLSRQSDLWRGIGIACVYVGGTGENILRELLAGALNHRSQLSAAAALVARTRNDADALTSDTELACRTWCNCSTEAAIAITITAEPLTNTSPANAYQTWLSNIITTFESVDKNY